MITSNSEFTDQSFNVFGGRNFSRPVFDPACRALPVWVLGQAVFAKYVSTWVD